MVQSWVPTFCPVGRRLEPRLLISQGDRKMDEGERLIEELGKARSAMQRALSCVDRQREICPGWTVKEVLAHISGWDAVGTSTVRAHMAGEQPPALEARGIDAYNAYVVAGCETLSLRRGGPAVEAGPQAVRGRPRGGPPREAQGPAPVSLGGNGQYCQAGVDPGRARKRARSEIMEMPPARGDTSTRTRTSTSTRMSMMRMRRRCIENDRDHRQHAGHRLRPE